MPRNGHLRSLTYSPIRMWWFDCLLKVSSNGILATCPSPQKISVDFPDSFKSSTVTPFQVIFEDEYIYAFERFHGNHYFLFKLNFVNNERHRFRFDAYSCRLAFDFSKETDGRDCEVDFVSVLWSNASQKSLSILFELNKLKAYCQHFDEIRQHSFAVRERPEDKDLILRAQSSKYKVPSSLLACYTFSIWRLFEY